MVTLAAADACKEVAELDTVIKWPNDLVMGDRKIAGVLAESVPVSVGVPGKGDPAQEDGGEPVTGAGHDQGDVADGGEIRAVVVGLGLNVRWPPPESAQGGSSQVPVPAEIADIATSLWREARPEFAQRLHPRTLLELVLGALEHRVDDLSFPDGRRRQAAEYRRRCGTVGRRVRVTVGEETFEGIAVDVNTEGHLVLADAEAHFHTITAGDVVHVD